MLQGTGEASATWTVPTRPVAPPRRRAAWQLATAPAAALTTAAVSGPRLEWTTTASPPPPTRVGAPDAAAAARPQRRSGNGRRPPRLPPRRPRRFRLPVEMGPAVEPRMPRTVSTATRTGRQRVPRVRARRWTCSKHVERLRSQATCTARCRQRTGHTVASSLAGLESPAWVPLRVRRCAKGSLSLSILARWCGSALLTGARWSTTRRVWAPTCSASTTTALSMRRSRAPTLASSTTAVIPTA
mmetsp:Transcript_3721/g.12039  ORF Transcript_3721/g.12039 Transcript_3721/m.12039 type:complete len:243 (-) Transcript_3721:1377-2105(-)